MKKIIKAFESGFFQKLGKLANKKWILAIRDGGVATLPLVIVGSIFLVFHNLPTSFEGLKPFFTSNILPYSAFYLNVFSYTFGFIGLYMAFSIAYNAAKYTKITKLVPLTNGIISLALFIILASKFTWVDTAHVDPLKSLTYGFNSTLDLTRFGGAGVFIAILCSFFTNYIYLFVEKNNITIKLPSSVPEGVANSFRALVPLFFVAIAAIIITALLAFSHTDIHEVFKAPFGFLTKIADSYVGIVLIVFLVMVLWSVGIHGSLIIQSIVSPIWLQTLAENAAAHAAGHPLQFVATNGFVDLYVWLGGTGATLAFVIMLLFSKSTQGKLIGRVSIVPGLFNINEPLVFGLPIIYNPYIIVPYILAPVVQVTVAYFAVASGLVAKVYSQTPWTVPGPIASFLATSDWKAPILSLVCFAISFVIYFPFFKAYDNKLLNDEKALEMAEKEDATMAKKTA